MSSKLRIAAVSVGLVIPFAIEFFTTVDPAKIRFPALRPLPDDVIPLGPIERLFENDPNFLGPESFVFNDDGSFFTGLANGNIVRILTSPHPSYKVLTRTGVDSILCGSLSMEPICGRPLGLRRDPRKEDSLLVADAYKGLLRVSTKDGSIVQLVDPKEHNYALINDLDTDGRNVYYSVTGRFPRNEIHRNIIESQANGSIGMYDLNTGQVSVIAQDLVMPNGVTLTHDGGALLVTSTALSAIYKINLKPTVTKQGVELVQNDLQGTPDNIRRRTGSSSSYFVALGSKRSSPFSLPQFLAPHLALRKAVSLLSLEILTAFIPRACMFVEVDNQGVVLHTFKAPATECHWLSEVEESVQDGYLYLGSWRSPYLARTRLDSI